MGENSSKQWVLLAAGSKGWENYRHQANVCHAYQIAKRNGIPDEQIVVMMYDDIAYNEENPYKGNIINVPKGENVYVGVPKDYTGAEVSAENFLAVLKGDVSGVRKWGPKKVIRSGSYDTIFVYLTDHGNSGIFTFPGSELLALELVETVTQMSRNSQFSKMVIYIESCHSGSMINDLPKDVNVYGVSSARSDQATFACYLDRDRNAYLSDEFSALWMHHIETSDLEGETLQDQFNYVKKNMKHSFPCQYGNRDIARKTITEFLGKSAVPHIQRRSWALKPTDIAPSYNVPLEIQANRIQRARDSAQKAIHEREYKNMLRTRKEIDKAVCAIAKHACPSGAERALRERRDPTQVRELKIITQHFRTCCYDWNDTKYKYAISHMHVFVNLCESGTPVERIMAAITQVSRTQQKH
ncbi:legumain-like isoform X1 [Lepisosteus oculatus]|uniref:legumain-like isoform X1 n=1 Tax=Lepisosteus oculatus TaxID=7918 RepID=UPI003722A4D4